MLIDFQSKSRPNKKAASLNWPLVYRTNNIHTLITASTAVGTIIWMSDISNSWISYLWKTLSKQFYNAGCCTTVSHVFTELKTLTFEGHIIKTENRFIYANVYFIPHHYKIKSKDFARFNKRWYLHYRPQVTKIGCFIEHTVRVLRGRNVQFFLHCLNASVNKN